MRQYRDDKMHGLRCSESVIAGSLPGLLRNYRFLASDLFPRRDSLRAQRSAMFGWWDISNWGLLGRFFITGGQNAKAVHARINAAYNAGVSLIVMVRSPTNVSKEPAMNTTPASHSFKHGIMAVMGLLVLLLGAATGNAYAMLAMAVIALVAMAIFERRELGRKGLLVMAVAAAIATAVAITITKL